MVATPRHAATVSFQYVYPSQPHTGASSGGSSAAPGCGAQAPAPHAAASQ
jgi:hypothetical protein